MQVQENNCHNYQEALQMVKQLKNRNDCISNSIGVESQAKIVRNIQGDNLMMEANMLQISQFITETQRSYVDPATSRRMATLKQQFRIQKDRRSMLILTVKYTEINSKAERNDEKEEETDTSTQQSSQINAKAMERNQLQPTKKEEPLYKYSSIFPADELLDPNESLIDHNSQNTSAPSKKKRLISYLQSNRKKIMYFLLFTAVKVGIYLLFFG